MIQLKFKHRKVVHYTLLISIILLQIIAILTWYNETKLAEAFDDMATAGKMNTINNALLTSQDDFNKYITTRDTTSLRNYAKSINNIIDWQANIASSNSNDHKEKLLKEKKTILSAIKKTKSSIDSIIENQITIQNNLPTAFSFNEFQIDKFLDDVKTDSYVKVDSASRKGLFSRLGDAIANRTNVQKEYVNTVVTMQYKDKVTTGNIEQQLSNAIKITNDYYAKEFIKLKMAYANFRANDIRLIDLNSKLLLFNQSLVTSYNKGNNLSQPQTIQNLEKEYQTSKKIRSYSIIILIILMLIISFILFNFTRLAFDYEEKITLSQERIRQSLNFKNRITGMISHEIRSPLSIISMYSKKSSATVNDIQLKETFKSIEFTTNSLLLLSNQILEYSRDENHKLSLKLKSTNLKEEINQILTSLASLLQTKGNTLVISSHIETNELVFADVAKIHQLFYNLIGNANKFTENGKINVDVNLETISDFEKNFKVIISDNGIGINKNDLENIFESYYQGVVSDNVTDLGVGLGLNICKEIIELFDGEIHIESEPNKGTKVTFNLILTQE